jgi:hypothetical protein
VADFAKSLEKDGLIDAKAMMAGLVLFILD